jgi:hypothetical protein
MKTTTILALIALLIVGPTSLYARIGESLAQCVERYGQYSKEWTPEGKDGSKSYLFNKGEFEITVSITDNAADTISYSKSGAGQPSLGASEKSVILKRNYDGEWKDKPPGPLWLLGVEDYNGGGPWFSGDGKLLAMTGGDNLLIILSAKMLNRANSNAAKEAEDKLQGF